MSNKRALLTYSSSEEDESTDEDQNEKPKNYKSTTTNNNSALKKTKLTSEKQQPTKLSPKPTIKSVESSINNSKKPGEKQKKSITKKDNQNFSDSETEDEKIRSLPNKQIKSKENNIKNKLADSDTSDDDTDKKKKIQPVLIELAISDKSNQNEKLTEILTALSIYEKNKGLIHKFTAYKKAVASIKVYPHKIKSGAEAKKLDGVGEKIAKKVQEILDTGKLKKLQNQKEDKYLTSLNDLTRVSGIGPKLAKKFVEEGINSVDDLKKIKDKLNHHQQIGLKYLDDFEKRVPRPEIEEMDSIVAKILKSIDKNIISQVCGSYRRGLPSSGDIDILISHPNYTLAMKEKKQTFSIVEKLVDRLKKDRVIIDDLSLGPFKYMGVCLINMNKQEEPDEDDDLTEDENEIEKKPKTITNNSKPIPRRIDFKLLPYESYYYGLLHCTGSDEFNRQMRVIALKKGYTLSEYSINKLINGKKSDEDIAVDSEKGIFDIIGLKYYSPTERNI